MSNSPDSLVVHVLGELEVDGVDSGAFGSRKARLLLTALALGRGRRVSVDALIEAVWDARPPARPVDQLAVLVSRLRSVLGRDRVEHVKAGYRLSYDWLDVDALEELAADADERLAAGAFTAAATAASAAMALIRGDIDDDLEGEWATSQIAAVLRLTSRARRLAAEAMLGVGDWSSASELATRALDEDPCAEDALRVLMRAEVAGGRTGAALGAYADLRSRFESELGTSPSPATESLHTAILRGELPVTAASSTPVPPPTLVGRHDQLVLLDELMQLHAPGATVILVSGEAGIGKSGLTQVWAAQRQVSGDVVVIVRCDPLDRSIPLGALTRALSAHLRRLDRGELAGILGPDHDVVAPLLGFAQTASRRSLLADTLTGPSLLYDALARVVERAAGHRRMILVVDDAHDSDRAMLEWLGFIARRPLPLVVIATARAGQTAGIPAEHTIELGPLEVGDVRELVGESRAESLFQRSGGNPLFLVELALEGDAAVPATLVEAIAARCADLGASASATLQSAAVIGTVVDLDLLATVLGRPPIEVLDDLELAASRRLLSESDGAFCFRHELVRVALAAGASPARTTLLHREAGRALARRSGDPSAIAHHARLGRDMDLAASALRAAAVRATELFDHATAESLLNQALEMHASQEAWSERARVKILREDYEGALDDVEQCLAAGGDAVDIGAWAAYFGRHFDLAHQYAERGIAWPAASPVRPRSLVIGGRISHATGDLTAAETQLTHAIGAVDPAEHSIATAWLGTLRSHQSRTTEALQLLGPATLRSTDSQHTPAVMHALLFVGHSLAIAGRPADAIEAFATYEFEATRRDVDRFTARGTNMTGWVLRGLGALDEAAELHEHAREVGIRQGFREMQVATVQDLAEVALWRGDPDEATRLLEPAQRILLDGEHELVFGWRLTMKLDWLLGRAALDREDPQAAREHAQRLMDNATARGIPRYASVAKLLELQALHRLGDRVEPDEAYTALDLVDRAIPLEAWWLTGALSAELGLPDGVERAADRARSLAGAAAARGTALRDTAAAHLDRWEKAALRKQ